MYRKNAMLRWKQEVRGDERAGLDCSPKRYENVSDVVHPGSVHESCFFVGRRHEQ